MEYLSTTGLSKEMDVPANDPSNSGARVFPECPSLTMNDIAAGGQEVEGHSASSELRTAERRIGELPADNGAITKAGYYAAKKQYTDLETLAATEAPISSVPDVYELLKRYASAQQGDGWTAPGGEAEQWLSDLALERNVRGSANASAWREALGDPAQDEIIVLPIDERTLVAAPVHEEIPVAIPVLEAYPNPSNGPIYFVCTVPIGVERAEVRLLDAEGRLIWQQVVSSGTGIVEMNTTTQAAGLYVAELRMDGIRAGPVKVSLQH